MRLEMLRDRGGIEGIDAQAKARSCVSVPCRRSSVQPSTSM